MFDKRKIICAVMGALMTGISAITACYFSSVELNKSKYTVWGVDVSNYQGIIDWKKLDSQDVSFAFIKATEGSSHVDESARRNLENAAETDIKVSAYHFFSFDSAGETQAANFISVVGADEIDMPPVVDIEY
ncbi:MAG: glycosyl hydrolase family 25, partial [Ruminococcus sp.]|nr:glycosyl hydrolase family 25 [Ruminococcus sp.]